MLGKSPMQLGIKLEGTLEASVEDKRKFFLAETSFGPFMYDFYAYYIFDLIL